MYTHLSSYITEARRIFSRLSDIFNISFSIDVFLSLLKVTKVILVHKKNLNFTANIKYHCCQILKWVWKYWYVTESGNISLIMISFNLLNLVFDITLRTTSQIHILLNLTAKCLSQSRENISIDDYNFHNVFVKYSHPRPCLWFPPFIDIYQWSKWYYEILKVYHFVDDKWLHYFNKSNEEYNEFNQPW